MDGIHAWLALVGSLGSGAVGGVFFAFSNFVMGALRELPTAHGVAAMQAINRTVLNPGFLGLFVGTAVVAAAAVVVGLMRMGAPDAPWLVAGGLLYGLGTFVVTGTRNVPRNEALAALDPAAPDAKELWSRYVREWTWWNHARTAAAIGAAVAFAVALVG